MDDALFVKTRRRHPAMTIAIADPTRTSPKAATSTTRQKNRAFTNYLPGFNIPMLPRECPTTSVPVAGRQPSSLACSVTLGTDGALGSDIRFFAATIESKAKLAYDNVSD